MFLWRPLEPLLRIAFGLTSDRHSVTSGLRSVAFGYLALAVSAAYWSSIEGSGIAASLLAGIAGGMIGSSA